MNRRTIAIVILVCVLACGLRPGAALCAQTGGATRLAQEQKHAGNWRRVLVIGAHPDDEDNDLLTILSRGMGIQTAYLSLTRGDGGQNLIGSELGQALGVLRTEELAAARVIDGGHQYFTRAFDFGFSKTKEETLRFWNHDSVLKDMVRIIRRFKPQVIVSVWSGTAADGHGHHQASGTLSLEAFHAAGDSMRFPELRREGYPPWQPSKFYRTAGRFFANGLPPTLSFDGNVFDPATGLSLHQLAVRSRSQHRSQNQGDLEELGPYSAGVRLEERIASITGADDSLFAGIRPESAPDWDAAANEAQLIRARIVLDATTDDDEVTPGQVVRVTLSVWNGGRDTVSASLRTINRSGFNTFHDDNCPRLGRTVAPGELFTCQYAVDVDRRAKPTSPYYLDNPRRGAMYQWKGPANVVWGEPYEPPLEASFAITSSLWTTPGGTVGVTREVQARRRDAVLGEVRHPVMIVPTIAVDLQPNARLWPSGVRTREYKVALEHLARDTSDASVSLAVPQGWTASPPQKYHFTREGERAVLTFKVGAPLNTFLDKYHIDARVVVGHDTMDTGIYRIRYPHIRDVNLGTAAQATIVVANVAFPKVGTIGYVRGGGDLTPEAMVNAGLDVSLLTGDVLERAPLDHYKVIVIGPRAYEADESLKRAHPKLMKWLEAGGRLIIQYQQTPYVAGGFPPKPFTLVAPTQSRVTDETAPVTLLAKTNPVLHAPNAIVNGDFDGWVQERGLNFPPTWDVAWTPILETHDSGGPPLAGGLLIAKVGRGTAVYTGLAFHRQLPAIVPGAWRLWANILAAGAKGAAH